MERHLELLKRVRRFPPKKKPKKNKRLKLSKNFRLAHRHCGDCCGKKAVSQFFIYRKKQCLAMGTDWDRFYNHFWGQHDKDQ